MQVISLQHPISVMGLQSKTLNKLIFCRGFFPLAFEFPPSQQDSGAGFGPSWVFYFSSTHHIWWAFPYLPPGEALDSRPTTPHEIFVISTDIQAVQLKGGPILIWVIYLLRFTTCYITQLTCIYSKCWKWCPLISMYLSTRFTMFLATFLSVLSFTSLMAWVIFIFKILNFSKKLCLQWA